MIWKGVSWDLCLSCPRPNHLHARRQALHTTLYLHSGQLWCLHEAWSLSEDCAGGVHHPWSDQLSRRKAQGGFQSFPAKLHAGPHSPCYQGEPTVQPDMLVLLQGEGNVERKHGKTLWLTWERCSGTIQIVLRKVCCTSRTGWWDVQRCEAIRVAGATDRPGDMKTPVRRTET